MNRKGQIYIPAINWLLLAGCVAVVLIFRKSSNMEAAYGLAITIDMLMTTTLLCYLIYTRFRSVWPVLAFGGIYFLIEGAFFLSNASKFFHGGWFTFLIAATLFIIMLALYKAMNIRRARLEYMQKEGYLPMLESVLQDKSIPLKATHLVYPVMSGRKDQLDRNVVQSLFYSSPKRANVYWFLHVDIADEPFGLEYTMEELIPGKSFYIRIKMGFKEPHKINKVFMKIVEELAVEGLVSDKNVYPSLEEFDVPPDFQFVLTSTRLTADVHLNPIEQFFIDVYRLVKQWSVSVAEDFGLEVANVEVETISIQGSKEPKVVLKRVK